MSADAQELFRHGTLLVDNEQLHEAAQVFSDLARILPENADLWAMIARIHLRRCDLDSHDNALERAMYLAPDRGMFQLRAALACPPLMLSTQEIARLRTRTLERLTILEDTSLRIEDIQRDIPTLTYYFAYHGENDREIQQRLCRVMRRMAPHLSFTAQHISTPSAKATAQSRPLKIGIYSPHLRDHTIGLLFGDLVHLLDRSIFTPILFLTAEDTDHRSSIIAQGASRVVTIPRERAAAISIMAAEQLDIMLYPDIGMDAFSTWLACARVARLQATTWGHPNTTGLDTVDAFFSLSDLETDRDNPPYTERVYTQEQPNIYYRPYRPPALPDRTALALPPGRLYGCPQALFKFHPDFDRALISILERDPEGTLVLYAGKTPAWQDTLLARLESQMAGISRRIHWIPNITREQYIGTLSALSVMLDPFPFGGGNTTLEALAVGTSVVTLPPRFARGRLAYTFLKQSKLLDGIARDLDDYVNKAIGFAYTDTPERRALIIEHSKCLFENTVGIREWENNLVKAWRDVS
jgi:protein O-GlcNAc transferase